MKDCHANARHGIPRRAAVAALGAVWIGTARASPPPITVGGTGMAIGLMNQLAGPFTAATGLRVSVLASLGSAGGLRALAAERLDVAMAITESPQDEVAPGIHLLGRTPMLVVANVRRPPTMLTRAQLAELLTGEVRHWPDGAPARVIVRPPHDREWHVLRHGPPELQRAAAGPAARLGEVVATTSQANAEAITAIEGSIGLIPLVQLSTEGIEARVIGVDGIMPSLATLRDGSWPYGITVSLVTRDEPDPRVQALLRFLEGAEARTLIERLGMEPIARAS